MKQALRERFPALARVVWILVHARVHGDRTVMNPQDCLKFSLPTLSLGIVPASGILVKVLRQEWANRSCIVPNTVCTSPTRNQFRTGKTPACKSVES